MENSIDQLNKVLFETLEQAKNKSHQKCQGANGDQEG